MFKSKDIVLYYNEFSIDKDSCFRLVALTLLLQQIVLKVGKLFRQLDTLFGSPHKCLELFRNIHRLLNDTFNSL